MSQQATIDAFRRAPMERIFRPPAAPPADPGERLGERDGGYCGNCGEALSARYRRVLGDREGRVERCPFCARDGGEL